MYWSTSRPSSSAVLLRKSEGTRLRGLARPYPGHRPVTFQLCHAARGHQCAAALCGGAV